MAVKSSDYAESAARFSKGSGVTSRDYSAPVDSGSAKALQESFSGYQRGMLKVVLSIILGVAFALWILDGISTVGALWYGAGVAAPLGLVIFLVVSLFQRHLLGFGAIIKKLFGEEARISRLATLIIGAVVIVVGALNIGSSALGVLYVLNLRGYNYLGMGPAAVGTLFGMIISNAELIAVVAWLALRWLRDQG